MDSFLQPPSPDREQRQRLQGQKDRAGMAIVLLYGDHIALCCCFMALATVSFLTLLRLGYVTTHMHTRTHTHTHTHTH